MGAVYRPEDALRRKRMLEKAARDLAPGQLDRVREIIERWDQNSEKEIARIIGEEKARRLLKELR